MSNKSQEIKIALKVLSSLDSDVKTPNLTKSLPVLAINLNKDGQNVTEELLLDYIKKGEGHIKETIEILKQGDIKYASLEKDYTKIYLGIVAEFEGSIQKTNVEIEIEEAGYSKENCFEKGVDDVFNGDIKILSEYMANSNSYGSILDYLTEKDTRSLLSEIDPKDTSFGKFSYVNGATNTNLDNIVEHLHLGGKINNHAFFKDLFKKYEDYFYSTDKALVILDIALRCGLDELATEILEYYDGDNELLKKLGNVFRTMSNTANILLDYSIKSKCSKSALKILDMFYDDDSLDEFLKYGRKTILLAATSSNSTEFMKSFIDKYGHSKHLFISEREHAKIVSLAIEKESFASLSILKKYLSSLDKYANYEDLIEHLLINACNNKINDSNRFLNNHPKQAKKKQTEIEEMYDSYLQKWLEIKDRMELWEKRYGCLPEGLEKGYSDHKVKIKDVLKIAPLLEAEGYDKEASNRYAYQSVALLGSADQVMDYFKRWGTNGKQPLHDIVHSAWVSQDSIKDGNLKSWGDALMRHGPKMAMFARFANKMNEPAKDSKGQWSYTKTRDEIAKFRYKNAKENLELAKLCMKYFVTEEDFDHSLTLIKEKSEKNIKSSSIPDIKITGKQFGMEGYSFKKLPEHDLRSLFLGEMVNCCQSIGGVGEDCTINGFISEQAGFYVIENDNTKEIIGETWAWRGQKDELVFDSLEYLGDRVKPEEWKSLSDAFAGVLEKTKKDHNVSKFLIGSGGNTPEGQFNKSAKKLAKPLDYKGYRDSKDKQYKIWSRKP